MRLKPLFSVLLFLLTLLPAQSAERQKVSLDVRPAYLFPSFKDDVMKEMFPGAPEKTSRFGTSIHLQYGFRFPSDTKQGKLSAEAWQGIGTGINFLGNPKGIGTPWSLYLFQGAPVFNISERLSLFYEWNFGISAGWKPCRGTVLRSNLIVGSSVNAYINLQAGIEYRLSPLYSLRGGIDITHFSNGNTSFPNPGVNAAGVKVGIVRYFGKRAPETPAVPDTLSGKRLGLDITAYGAWRKRVYRGGDHPVLLRGHFAVAGLDISPMWRVTRNFRAGASADFQWDSSTGLKRYYLDGATTEDIRFAGVPFFRQVCAGISGRAELVMPLFSVNVGIGYNILGPEETRASYQLANLKIRLTDAFYLNIGYQLLNFSKQNNLMLGCGYSLWKSSR